MRNGTAGVGASAACSAFRLPRSALGSPRPLRHGRDECLQPSGGELQRLSLLGAHVGRHQELHYFDAVVEGQLGRLTLQEGAHEVAVPRPLAAPRPVAPAPRPPAAPSGPVPPPGPPCPRLHTPACRRTPTPSFPRS